MKSRSHQHLARQLLVAGAVALVLLAVALDGFQKTSTESRASANTGNTQITLHDLTSGSRHSSYAALRDNARGALIVADIGATASSQVADLDRSFLLVLGGSADIKEIDISQIELPTELPTGKLIASGQARGGPWQLQIADTGVPEIVLARVDDGVLRMVDARLVPDWDDGLLVDARPSVTVRGPAPPAAIGGLVDGSLLVLLLVTGWLLLAGAVPSPVGRVALALPVGLATVGALGMVRIPGVWAPVVAFAIATGVHQWSRRGTRSPVIERSGALPLAVAAGIAVGAAMWSRSRGFLWTSPDSISYLAQGRLFADGDLTTDLIRLKRGLAQQQLHAPGFAVGVEGFQSLGLAVLIAGAGLLLVLPLLARPSSGASVSIRAWMISGSVALILFAAPAIPIMAAYVNAHVLLAVLLLALVLLLGWQVPPGSEPSGASGPLPAVIVLLGAVVLLRPEGTLLAGLVLLGTLRRGRMTDAWHWRALGVATLAWNAILVHGHLARAESVSRVVLAMLAIGVVLMLVPEVLRRAPSSAVRALPVVVGTGLWGVTLLLIGNIGNIGFLDAIIGNIGEGQGRWGVVGVLLFIVGAVAVAMPERASDGPGLSGARWALIGFIPLTMFSKLGDGLQSSERELSTLLSGGGRIGWGDSVNRMWMHAILLVLAMVIVRFTEQREPSPSGPQGPGRAATAAHRARRLGGTVGPVGRAVAVGVVVVWVASHWAPFYIAPATASQPLYEERTLVVDGGASAGIHRFVTAGEEYSETVPVGGVIDLPGDLRERSVCASPQVLVFGREPAELRVTFDVSGVLSERIVEVRGSESPVVCVPVTAGQSLPSEAVVTVEALTTPVNADVALLRDDAGPQDADRDDATRPSSAEQVAAVAPSVVPAARIAVRVDVRGVVPVAPVAQAPDWHRAPDAATLGIPMIVAVLVTILMFLEVPDRRRRAATAPDVWGRAGGGAALAGALILSIGLGPKGGEVDVSPVLSGVWNGPQQPAGELVDRARIVQPVAVATLPDLTGVGLGQQVCVEVLLATYHDRANEGTLLYELTDGVTASIASVDQAAVLDNTWTTGCFDDGAAAMIDAGRPLTLQLRGVDGQPGRSVTAWLRPSGPSEQVAQVVGTAGRSESAAVGGSAAGEVLRYRFAIATAPMRDGLITRTGQIALVSGVGALLAAGIGSLRRRRAQGR